MLEVKLAWWWWWLLSVEREKRPKNLFISTFFRHARPRQATPRVSLQYLLNCRHFFTCHTLLEDNVLFCSFILLWENDFIELYACYPLLSVSLSHPSFDTSITRQLFGWLVAWYKFHIKKLCMRVSVCDANILYIWWWMEKSFRFLIYLVRWCVLLSLARTDECNVYYGLYWCFFLDWIAI